MLTAPPSFLAKHLPGKNDHSLWPWITVTWAQSLDAKISGKDARVILSGPESYEMTHWMRTMHDAILIGINTLIMDDPRLQIQLVPQDDPSLLPPQPLILDPSLRFPFTAKVLSEWKYYKDNPSRKVIRQPWVICGDNVPSSKIQVAEEAGLRVIPVLLDNGRISPNALPLILTSLGLKSVMIEGGSRILSSFLHAPPRADGSPLVDSVIVTVAPMFIGDGVPLIPPEESSTMPILNTVWTETMGKDSVMVCTLQPCP